MADEEAVFFFLAKPCPFIGLRTRRGAVGPGRRRDVSQGFILFFLSRCEVGVEEDGEERSGEAPAEVFFFFFASLCHVVLGRWRRILRLGGASSLCFLLFFLSTLPLPGGGVEAEPQARSFDRLFSVLFFFALLAEASALQAPQGSRAQRRQGASFSFFFRSPGRTGRALSSPSRRVLRRSDVGFFFLVRTSGSTAEARVSVLEEEKARPCFFGVGRGPQIRFAGGVDEGARRAGAFPFLLFPPFFGVFSL